MENKTKPLLLLLLVLGVWPLYQSSCFAQSPDYIYPVPEKVVFQQLPTIVTTAFAKSKQREIEAFLYETINKSGRYQIIPTEQNASSLAPTHSLQMTIAPMFYLQSRQEKKDSLDKVELALYKYEVKLYTKLKIVDIRTGELAAIPTISSRFRAYAKMDFKKRSFQSARGSKLGPIGGTKYTDYGFPSSSSSLRQIWKKETQLGHSLNWKFWKKNLQKSINNWLPFRVTVKSLQQVAKSTMVTIDDPGMHNFKTGDKMVLIYRKPYKALNGTYCFEKVISQLLFESASDGQLTFRLEKENPEVNALWADNQPLHIEFPATSAYEHPMEPPTYDVIRP